MTAMGKRAPIIGVTGLPCCGKSYISELLTSGNVSNYPGVVVRADDLGHVVLRRAEVVREISDKFGATVLADNGSLDRAKVAAVVFTDAASLLWLESYLHPLIDREAMRLVGETGGKALIALEAALLFAGHMEQHCDVVLLVEADRPVRLARAEKRGWDEKELSRREARQLELFTKDKLAQYDARIITIQNNTNDSDGELITQLQNALAVAEKERDTQ